MTHFKGIIALDIDGTITSHRYLLDPAMTVYFNRLIQDHWCLVFISGRAFATALPVLSSLTGEYYLAVQNGAALYRMPRVEQVKKHYLSTESLVTLEALFGQEKQGLLVEMGAERDDVCYYKPQDFSEEDKTYLQKRMAMSPHPWIAVQNFNDLAISGFPAGKFFALQHKAEDLAQKLHLMTPYRATVIRDPWRSGFCLAHINAAGASKGTILDEVIALHSMRLPVIVAGDDYNDLPMLEKGDVKIVIEHAPASMHAIADVIASSPPEKGLLVALQKVLYERYHYTT